MIWIPKKGQTCFVLLDWWETFFVHEAKVKGWGLKGIKLEWDAMDKFMCEINYDIVPRRDVFATGAQARIECAKRNAISRERWRG